MAIQTKHSCKHLVLDAGPLLSLSPIRGLAETYYTVPQVLDELKDQRAREHFEKLGLAAGVRIQVQSPDAASLARVIQYAKKTGDYSVLSHADLCVLALTYALHSRGIAESSNTVTDAANSPSSAGPSTSTLNDSSSEGESEKIFDEVAEDGLTAQNTSIDDAGLDDSLNEDVSEEDGEEHETEPQRNIEDETEREPLEVELRPISDDAQPSRQSDATSTPPPDIPSHPPLSSPAQLYEDPVLEDDGEGEWITPDNVTLHKSRHLELLPSSASKSGKQETIHAGCMTADFAMQNVLLQMGLNLVGVEGKKIQKVKTWVLRCHACFKICKDSSRKFCPSCGNSTLLRVSVTLASPDASPDAPVMQVHLKKNFQYKLRGSIYSIPSPKAGSAKTGPGEGLILREDQTEYMRAKKRMDAKKERDERKMFSYAVKNGGQGVAIGSWMDPDWVPEIISVGTGGKGRSLNGKSGNGMPTVGHGRKNPNEKRRRPK